MQIRLFLIHGSHPCDAAVRALELKGLEFSVWEWPPPFQAVGQTLLFGNRTVPAITYGSQKAQGSRAIFHALDTLAPEPRLYPSEPPRRARVEEADEWGDTQFQQVARDLLWAGVAHRPEVLAGYAQGSRLPLPPALVRLNAPMIARGERALNRTSDATAAARLAELPAQIAKLDGWISDGTIGDLEHPTAADLQILSTVRLLQTIGDARALFSESPAPALAEQLFGGRLSGELPAGTLV